MEMGGMMLKKLVKKWAVNDEERLPITVEFICLLSYGATESRLTKGSNLTTQLAIKVSKIYPEARVLWGTLRHKNSSNEGAEKNVALDKTPGIDICVGKVSSTTDECEMLVEKMFYFEYDKFPRNIIVISEGSQSRRARIFWRWKMPKTNIFFISVPAEDCADRENPMWLQRNWRVWFLFNIITTPFYFFFPGIMAELNFHQPTK